MTRIVNQSIHRGVNMNYLVTGGAGFIGSNLVDRLIADGHNVTVIDDESSIGNDRFYWNPAARNYRLDVTDFDKTCDLYRGIDMVFHLAAESKIQMSILDPLKTVQTNILGTATVLECSHLAGVKRVMYSSTSAVYGEKNSAPFIETMPTDCLNPYSMSKVAGEELCKMYSRLYGLETIIFRYFNVYGERQPFRGDYAPVIAIFQRQKNDGDPLTIVGTGNQSRDFVHVSDVVEANILGAKFSSVDSNWKWGQIYNVGSGTAHSVNEISKMIGGPTIHLPCRKGEMQTVISNCLKIKTDLGWVAKIKLEDWISQK